MKGDWLLKTLPMYIVAKINNDGECSGSGPTLERIRCQDTNCNNRAVDRSNGSSVADATPPYVLPCTCKYLIYVAISSHLISAHMDKSRHILTLLILKRCLNRTTAMCIAIDFFDSDARHQNPQKHGIETRSATTG